MPIAIIATRTRAVSPLSMPLVIRKPTPDFAPSISAASTTIHPVLIEVLIPARMVGSADGTAISNKSCLELA